VAIRRVVDLHPGDLECGLIGSIGYVNSCTWCMLLGDRKFDQFHGMGGRKVGVTVALKASDKVWYTGIGGGRYVAIDPRQIFT
jgi:hypothetical protein